MGLLQATGIASQAGDAFDDARQRRRMASLQEQAVTDQLNNARLYQEIIKLAYAHERATEEAEAAAKAQPKGAIAPIAAIPALARATEDVEAKTRYADGGSVEKFDGIYDDLKVKDSVPSFYQEFFSNASPRSRVDHKKTLRELVGHIKALADGGYITNGVPMVAPFADGGEVKGKKGRKTLWEYATHKFTHGGPVVGPGTGTSDSVPATGPGGQPYRLSNGEYVLSADTVSAVGKHNLDALQARFHKPVR